MIRMLVILLWMVGVDSVSADWFRTWYHSSDMIHYLEAMSDHTIVETHTTGQWSDGERMAIAIEGTDYSHTRYYIDGFRVDDRFQPGSSLYRPDMQRYDMTIGTHDGTLRFRRDTAARDYVRASYNFGQVGNGAPAAGTQAIINLQHPSPVQSADRYKHISARRHYKGAGTAEAAYTISGLTQHLSAAYGQRLITRQDQQGLITDAPYYSADYYKVQADGDLPLGLHYRMNFSGRSDGGSEFYYNDNEVYRHRNYSASLWYTTPGVGSRKGDLTTGLTWATNTIHHSDRSFARNIVDQDGESFEPWIPDGRTHEFTWALAYELPILPWLHFSIDAYNSLIAFRPEVEHWTNRLYVQGPIDAHPTELQPMEWSSRACLSGLLENTFSLRAEHAVHPMVDLHGQVSLTLDAMILGHGMSKVSPNIEAEAAMDFHPCRWFDLSAAVGHYRLAYTTDYLRFFSPDYLSHGTRHSYQPRLSQTAYLQVDIPFRFHFTDRRKVHHEFVFKQSYRKYYHVWRVNTLSATGDQPTYIVGYTPSFGSNPLLNSPHYFSQLSRYTLTGPHVTFSLSWQSMQAAGYAALGNGATANSNGVLSESTALPSTTQVFTNPNGKYPGVSRVDLDKGFVCRIYFGYNICRWVQMGFTAKWTDGKPFTAYRYQLQPTTGDQLQAVIYPMSSRGINPTDGNFGTRNCANWQIDLHVQGCWWVNQRKMTLNLACYNVYDFACDQAEIAFYQDIPQATRSSAILNVPTGLLLTYRTEL